MCCSILLVTLLTTCCARFIDYTLSQVGMCRKRPSIYCVEFGTIPGFRHPRGSWNKHVPQDKGDNYIRKTYVCGYTFLPPENINISVHTRPSAPATKHASRQNGASILLPTYTHQACLPVTPQRIVKIHSSKSPKLPTGGWC